MYCEAFALVASDLGISTRQLFAIGRDALRGSRWAYSVQRYGKTTFDAGCVGIVEVDALMRSAEALCSAETGEQPPICWSRPSAQCRSPMNKRAFGLGAISTLMRGA